MGSEKRPIYDLEFIKSIPIHDILSDYGIIVRRDFFAVRDEKTPSCKAYQNTNTWIDFGGGSNLGGTTVDLAMVVEELSFKEAVQVLGNRYDAPILNQGRHDPQRKTLSNTQYNLIGLAGSPAYRNILLPKYADSFTPQMIQDYRQKYDIPMNKLFSVEPMTYASIIGSESIPYMKEFHSSYLQALHELWLERQTYSPDSTEIQVCEEFTKSVCQEYTAAYAALEKATQGTDVSIKGMAPDFSKDLQQISKKSIEVGEYPYSDLKALPGDTWHTKVPYSLYRQTKFAMDIGDIQLQTPFSVHVKGDTATVSYKSQDENTIKGIFGSMELMNKYQKQNEQQQPKVPRLGIRPGLGKGLEL